MSLISSSIKKEDPEEIANRPPQMVVPLQTNLVGTERKSSHSHKEDEPNSNNSPRKAPSPPRSPSTRQKKNVTVFQSKKQVEKLNNERIAVASRTREKVRVTIHSINGVSSSHISSSYLQWRLTLNSIDGKTGQVLRSSVGMIENEQVTWEESFEFVLEHEGQVLELKLKETDRVFGLPARKLNRGVLYTQLYSGKLKNDKIIQKVFRLRSPDDTSRVGEGIVTLSVELIGEEEEMDFWKMFERQEVDIKQLQERIKVDGFSEDQLQLTVILQHIKPILEAYWVLLYTILRPIYWTVVEIRTILTDWEDPGLTILCIAVGFWMWFTENILAGIFVLVTVKLYFLMGSQKTVNIEHLEPRQMLLAYGESRKALYYGRIDPLSYKLLSVESKLQKAGRALLNLEASFLRGDKKTSRKILGGLVVFILALLLLPVGSIIVIAIRLVFLYFLVTASIIVPLRRRLPLLMPGLKKTLKTYISQFMEKVFIPFRNKYYQLVSKIRASDDEARGVKKELKLSAEEWQRVCKDIGTKTTFSKGETIGRVGETSENIYRLVAGQVLIRSDNGIDVVAAAPATLLSTNALIGHGRQGHEIVAKKFCVAYALNKNDFRFYMVSHPDFARKFWSSMAVKIGVEVKHTIESWVHSSQQEIGRTSRWNMDNHSEKQEMARTQAMIHDLTHEKKIAISSPKELEIFRGVSVKQRQKASSLRKTSGSLILTSAYLVFYCEDRTMAELDQVIPLARVEHTKVRPAKHFVVGKSECCLKITVAQEERSSYIGGAAAAVRGFVLSQSAVHNDTIFSDQEKYRFYVADWFLVKRVMRAILGRLAMLNIKTGWNTNFFGPMVLGVELTKGLQKISESEAKALAVELREKDIKTMSTTIGEPDDSVESIAPEEEEEGDSEVEGLDCATELLRIYQKRFEVLSNTDRIALEKESYKLDRIYNKGTTILEESKFYDSIFFLLKGELEFRVRGIGVVTINADENQYFVFGTVNYILGEANPFSVHSKSRVTIRELSSKVIDRISGRDPFWGARLYEYLSYDLVNTISQIWVESCKGDDMLLENEKINSEALKEEGDTEAAVSVRRSFVLAKSASGFQTSLKNSKGNEIEQMK